MPAPCCWGLAACIPTCARLTNHAHTQHAQHATRTLSPCASPLSTPPAPQLYGDQEVKLNDVVEVVGVLRWVRGGAVSSVCHAVVCFLVPQCHSILASGLAPFLFLHPHCLRFYPPIPAPSPAAAACRSWLRRTCSRSRAARCACALAACSPSASSALGGTASACSAHSPILPFHFTAECLQPA